jgi:hypothetical protein
MTTIIPEIRQRKSEENLKIHDYNTHEKINSNPDAASFLSFGSCPWRGNFRLIIRPLA